MRTALEISLKDAIAEKTLLEQRYVQLERLHQEMQSSLTYELEEKTHLYDDQIQKYQFLLQEKDSEITQLHLQVELASKTSMEEVNETRQRIEESLKELEAHKHKRLAARNEMISLAKSLEVSLTLVVLLVFVLLTLLSFFLLLIMVGFGTHRKQKAMAKKSNKPYLAI